MRNTHLSGAKTILTIFIILIIGSCSDNSPTSPTPPDKPTPKLDKPSLISPKNKARNKATTAFFQWNSVKAATGYELQIAPTSDFSNPFVDKSNLQTPYYTASGLQQQTDYYWRVRAKNGSGTSPWSSVWTLHVNQEIQLADKTKLLPNKVADMISDTTMHLSTITIAGSNKFIRNLKKGNILLAQVSEKLPHGALRKITQISRSGNKITIKTAQATLVETLKEANIHINVPLKSSQTISGKTYSKSGKNQGTSGTVNIGTFSRPINNVVLYDADGDKIETTNDQVRLNGKISFTPTLEVTIIKKKFAGVTTGLEKFEFIIHSDFNSDINITSGVSYSAGKKYSLFNFPVSEVMAGPVPIIPTVEFYVGISGEVSAGLTTGVNYKYHTDAGIKYEDKDWSTISKFDQSIDNKPVQATLKASAKAYGEVDLAALIADAVGPYVDFQGYLRAEVRPLKNPWWSLYWGLAAGGGVKVEILSHDILDYQKPDIISREHLIDQADGGKGNPKLSFSPSSFNFPAKATAKTLTIDNTGDGSLQWNVSSDAGWISFEPSSGTGKKDVKINAKENTSGQQRKATIKIGSNGGDSDPIAVTQSKAQAAPELSVSPTSLSFSAKTGTKTLKIENTGGGSLQWQVSSDATWLTGSSNSGTGKAELTISAQKNYSGQQRSAEISVTSNGGEQTVSVAQSKADQAEPNLSFSPTSFDLPAPSGSTTLSIDNTGNGTLEWTVASGSDWLSFTPSSGAGKAKVEITYKKNSTDTQRSAHITITSNGGNSGPIAVTQQKQNQENDAFYLAENGITVRCPEANVGDTGTVNGVTYTKRSKTQITVSNAATTCTSGITDMSAMFQDAKNFNENIGSWDVGRVTDMSWMFAGANSFNQPIGHWNVSGVTNMSYMFVASIDNSSSNQISTSRNKISEKNIIDKFDLKLSNLSSSSSHRTKSFNSSTNNSNKSNNSSFNQDIGNWDVGNVKAMEKMFLGADSFNQDIGSWDVSQVSDMNHMFAATEAFNQPIGNWKVYNVTDMSYMFAGTNSFNQPIGNWDVSNVVDMRSMFWQATSFNQPIDNWNVSNVLKMWSMFEEASSFNKPIGNWDISSVTDIHEFFRKAVSFNQSINSWDVSNVTNMRGIFAEAKSFNKPLNNWDVSNVKNMEGMFYIATNFNQPLSNWDVSNVSSMGLMFRSARAFNQEINKWNVSNVTNMKGMFNTAVSFNQTISSWDVGNVKNMNAIFALAYSFDQPIGNWDVSSVTIMKAMFYDAKSFNKDINDWCVSKIKSEPEDFSGGSPLTEENKPVWGTCPK